MVGSGLGKGQGLPRKGRGQGEKGITVLRQGAAGMHMMGSGQQGGSMAEPGGGGSERRVVPNGVLSADARFADPPSGAPGLAAPSLLSQHP